MCKGLSLEGPCPMRLRGCKNRPASFPGWMSYRVVVSEMTYTVSSGTLNSTIPYHTIGRSMRRTSHGSVVIAMDLHPASLSSVPAGIHMNHWLRQEGHPASIESTESREAWAETLYSVFAFCLNNTLLLCLSLCLTGIFSIVTRVMSGSPKFSVGKTLEILDWDFVTGQMTFLIYIQKCQSTGG